MNIREAYTQWATTYDTDRNLTRDLDHHVTRRVLAEHRCAALLELGCGTGKNTPFYASISQRVYAFDFSDGMLAQAKAKIQTQHVQFAAADITRPLPCTAKSVDLVACNLILEHIAGLAALFGEVSRVLPQGGHFFVCELHPFRQYLGKKAVFEQGGEQAEIPAFVHHLSDFFEAADGAGLTLKQFGEWWHDEDQNKPPRLVSFLFER
jgi:malonyl-CoA O-methyltransferase